MTKWVNDSIKDVVDFIKEQTDNIWKWLSDELPKVVEGMFDWLKPIVDPIKGIADFAGKMVGYFTGDYTENIKIKENKDATQKKKEEIKDLLKEI
jgi:hypothetical protein